eukprot:g8163.t1
MSEYVVSKFIPLPDVAPVPENCTTSSEYASLHFLSLNICSPDNVEYFTNDFSSEAYTLLAVGDESFRKGYFREAIQCYTDMLKKYPSDNAIQGTTLAKRSGTFSMMACELRLRPVGACALYGMDAFGVAKLALKDAERILELFPHHTEGFLRSAFAFYLSENYEKAHNMCLEGIQWNFENTCLKECLKLVQAQLAGTVSERSLTADQQSVDNDLQGKITRNDFECTLCLKLFHQPVTTPCGHSFCSACLQRSLDHSNKCPICRKVIHVGRTLPISVTLNNLVSQLFTEEVKERESELATVSGTLTEQEMSYLPVFVLFTLFPGEKMALNVFEPRYRLMIRRVMEGNRCFGMIQASSQTSNGISRVGTECEIVECEPLADGRYFLEVIGRRRFEVIEEWDQDGYRVVEARFFKDQELIPGSQNYKTMETHLPKIEELETFFKAHGMYYRQSCGPSSDRMTEKDMETMSFLACALLVNPDGSSARRRYLETRSTLQRTEWIMERSPLR